MSRSSGCRRTLSDAPRRAVHAPAYAIQMLVCCLRCLHASPVPLRSHSTAALLLTVTTTARMISSMFVLLPVAVESHS